MTTYLALIYGDEQAWAASTPEQSAAVMAAHGAFAQGAGSALLGGNELAASSTATTLRANGSGKPTVTDGPFAETKEALGGYYLLQAPDLDAAIALASGIPELAQAGGAVEIRPVPEHG
jgi:hypothetical protein